MQYLMHWEGYGDKHDQWIAETGLPHAKETIEDYWLRILVPNTTTGLNREYIVPEAEYSISR